MRTAKASLDRLNSQGRGLLPIPALIIITYGILCYLILIFCMGLPLHHIFEFMSLPQFIGLSLLDLFFATNILLAAYLLVSFWAFVSEKINRSIRAVSYWTSYIVSFVLLVMVHVWIHNVGNEFELPGEILALRTSEYHVLQGTNFEDMLLPYSDMCQGFKKPFEERAIVNIDRKGRFIKNRRCIGRVGDVIDTIHTQLRSRAAELEREPDGTSNLILLLRVDTLTEFKHVHKVLEICKEIDVGIHRIEFACYCDLSRKAPEAVKKMTFPYWLPEGKLDAYLPKDGAHEPDEEGRPGRIEIEVFRKRKAEAGYYIAVNDDRFEGAEMLQGFQSLVKELHARRSDLEALIVAHDEVQHGHIVEVFTECLRAGISEVAFDCAPSVEHE